MFGLTLLGYGFPLSLSSVTNEVGILCVSESKWIVSLCEGSSHLNHKHFKLPQWRLGSENPATVLEQVLWFCCC